MEAQLRIYTINKGEMDAFLERFEELFVPLCQSIDAPIIGAWVNRPQNEFIYTLSYKDEADRVAKTAAFRSEVGRLGIDAGQHIAKMEVRDCEVAFLPAGNGGASGAAPPN